jgi:hypothetical protein
VWNSLVPELLLTLPITLPGESIALLAALEFDSARRPQAAGDFAFGQASFKGERALDSFLREADEHLRPDFGQVMSFGGPRRPYQIVRRRSINSEGW